MPHDPVTQLDGLQAIRGRKPLGQRVFEQLRQSIIRGDIRPGQRLVENRVAESMAISRTPVREALHKLEREFLLQKQPRGGYIVLGLSRSEIEETFGIRGVLESYAARLAALKHTSAQLEPLARRIDAYQASLDQGRLDLLPGINTEFHDLLYALSRSPKLIAMISGLRDQIFRFRQIILEKGEMAERSNADHRQMLDHIRRRDADGVERLVRDHILRGQDVVLAEFDRHPAPGGGGTEGS